jgi:hypothetical protein
VGSTELQHFLCQFRPTSETSSNRSHTWHNSMQASISNMYSFHNL